MTKEFQEMTQAHLDKLGRSWSRLIDCISHDVMSPLVIIRMTGQHLEKLLPDLVNGYELALRNQLLSEPSITENNIKTIREMVIPNINNGVTKIIEFLNLLHPYDQKLLSADSGNKKLSAKFYVEEALKKYPFDNSQERQLIQANIINDFQFNIAPFFMEHLLNHLLNNSIRMISEVGKGKITIWTDEEENFYNLHFKDTAIGMKEDSAKQIFDRFFSKRAGKIIPGLGFCRLALLQRGGDIICYTTYKEHTEFVLKFRKISKNSQ